MTHVEYTVTSIHDLSRNEPWLWGLYVVVFAIMVSYEILCIPRSVWNNWDGEAALATIKESAVRLVAWVSGNGRERYQRVEWVGDGLSWRNWKRYVTRLMIVGLVVIVGATKASSLGLVLERLAMQYLHFLLMVATLFIQIVHIHFDWQWGLFFRLLVSILLAAAYAAAQFYPP